MLRGGVSVNALRRLEQYRAGADQPVSSNRQHFSERNVVGLELAELVHAAGEGDQTAWNSIVERFSGLVWATVRAHRLSAGDSAEVVQTTWLRLVEHLDRIRDPERLGGWLATTARNECLRQIRHGAREVPSDMAAFEGSGDLALDHSLLTAERDRAFWKAFTALGERCQALLRVLMADVAPSYQEVAEALGMPIGAIGPTRRRCLERLRQDPQLAAFNLEEAR
jgi:RNA polymerase sigma factor (sigma-70 family)